MIVSINLLCTRYIHATNSREAKQDRETTTEKHQRWKKCAYDDDFGGSLPFTVRHANF